MKTFKVTFLEAFKCTESGNEIQANGVLMINAPSIEEAEDAVYRLFPSLWTASGPKVSWKIGAQL